MIQVRNKLAQYNTSKITKDNMSYDVVLSIRAVWVEVLHALIGIIDTVRIF